LLQNNQPCCRATGGINQPRGKTMKALIKPAIILAGISSGNAMAFDNSALQQQLEDYYRQQEIQQQQAYQEQIIQQQQLLQQEIQQLQEQQYYNQQLQDQQTIYEAPVYCDTQYCYYNN